MAETGRAAVTSPCVRIESGDQIPAEWGKPLLASSRATVTVREPKAGETFDKPWGSLSATPGVDLVVIQDGGEEHPVKKTIFAKTYEEVATGRYRKTALSRLIRVPEDVVAVLATLEGEIEVAYPDFIAIGAEEEVYANASAWVADNLDLSP